MNRVPWDVIQLRDLEHAREAWGTLEESCSNIFSTWDWADVWWRQHGAGRALELTSVRVGGEVVAILPMYSERRGGLRITRFVGNQVADQLGPVCDQPNVHVAASALSALTGSGAVLLAERLPADREWGGLRGVPIHRDSSPVIDIEEGGWDGYLNGRSANFRQQIRRRSRRLERGLGVTFRLTDSPDHLERDLDALVKLHAARWGAKSSALEAPKEAFHRAFAARALERGRLRLWVAEAEGTPVAVWYGFRFASVEYYYQSGRDPAWDRFSLGAGILEHSIREACADGMREYRLLRGDEAYKSRYATRDPGLVTIAAARRPLGRTVVAVTARLATSKTGLRLLKPFA